MTTVTINESQKRTMATSLGLLDEALVLFEEYAKGREVHSVCFEERNRLTARQRRELLQEISRIRAVMSEMKAALGLRMRVVEVGKRIWGEGAGFWEVLAEMEPKRLRAYGDVHAELAEYMAPQVQALLQGMMRISGIVGSGRP